LRDDAAARGEGQASAAAFAQKESGYYPCNVFTALLLAEESPAGRAITLTCSGSALSLGQGLGEVVGGLALILGGWVAVGLFSFTLMLAAAGLVWWSGRRVATAPAPVVG
jgi:predicted MFS family arabinose efflux permease